MGQADQGSCTLSSEGGGGSPSALTPPWKGPNVVGASFLMSGNFLPINVIDGMWIFCLSLHFHNQLSAQAGPRNPHPLKQVALETF